MHIVHFLLVTIFLLVIVLLLLGWQLLIQHRRLEQKETQFVAPKDHVASEQELETSSRELETPVSLPDTLFPSVELEQSEVTAILGENSDEEVTLLLVEDDLELCQFISKLFEDRYKVIVANDGEEALNQAYQLVPDLILCNLQLPHIDGFQLAMQLRQQPQLRHIPLVMLSDLTDNETKLRCLELGVDGFITKPINANFLIARVANLLLKRFYLQTYYKNLFSISAINADSLSMNALHNLPSSPLADTEFIELVMKHMQENLGNADYSVDDMAEAVNMSRSAFTRKLKALMGQSPLDILRDMRMRRAVILIDAGQLSITQVAYESGFNDPHYFGKCFKAFYQMTPSEWKSRQR